MRGVVLAGGESNRMGQEKALMEYKGKTLLEYGLDSIKEIPGEPLIVSNNRVVQVFLKDMNVEVIPDFLRGRGPLGGIHTALSHIKDDAFIVACDTPFLESKTNKKLLQQRGKANVAVYINEGKIFPFPGVYSINLLEVIETRLEGAGHDLFLQDFIRTISNIKYVEITKGVEALIGINTPEDYRRITSMDM